MKISVNWIREFLDFELPETSELIRRIGAQLGEVEEVIDLGAKYNGIPIVKVVECSKLENSDHLNLCFVDDGGVVKDVERRDDGLVQVLTGAPNVHAGMLAVWLPPGSTVPESFDSDPFVLSSREMRGSMSHGMLASARELAIGDAHEGIVEIIEGDLPVGIEFGVLVGKSFAEVFSLDDTIIDIENKMFTHRPDCFGQLGVAREISGIFGHKFTSPDWYLYSPSFARATEGELKFEVENEAPDKVSRFMAVAMKNVEVGPSPLWLQCRLAALGAKSINNVVDLTNYIMLLTAQPTHAYDYDKLNGHKLVARMACRGEKAKLLNGKTYELTEDDIVIADGNGVVGLAGIMGGLDSEVDENTKNIVLECANFDLYSVRKSSMRQGVFTDALMRFNKGQSPLQNDRVLDQLMSQMTNLASASQASPVFDCRNEDLKVIQKNDRVDLGKYKNVFKWGNLTGVIVLENSFVNDRLGLSLSPTDICKLLRNVEINANEEPEPNTPNELEAIAPFWRTDLELPEDIVEEVGRLYGYDKLPLELPRRSIKPAAKNDVLELKSKIRWELSKAGANEVLTYSFVHGNLLEKVGQDPKDAFKLANALSPDLQYYRLSLTPSLLEKVHPNIKSGHDEFALFELGKAHDVTAPSIEGLPLEFDSLALVYANKANGEGGSAYYRARKYLLNLSSALGQQLEFRKLPEHVMQLDVPFDLERSAVINLRGFEQSFGIVGEYSTAVRRNLKLPVKSAGFEIGFGAFLKATPNVGDYVPLPRFPKVSQDITLKVKADLAYQELYDLVWSELSKVQPENTLPSLAPLGIYQSEEDKAHKNVTFRFEIANYEKTMQDAEVTKMLDAVAESAKAKFSAARV